MPLCLVEVRLTYGHILSYTRVLVHPAGVLRLCAAFVLHPLRGQRAAGLESVVTGVQAVLQHSYHIRNSLLSRLSLVCFAFAEALCLTFTANAAMGARESRLPADNMSEDTFCDASELLFPMQGPKEGRDAVEAVLNNHDILKLLFGDLGFPDLCRASSVCRTWRAVSCSDDFWRDVSFEGRHITPQQV